MKSIGFSLPSKLLRKIRWKSLPQTIKIIKKKDVEWGCQDGRWRVHRPWTFFLVRVFYLKSEPQNGIVQKRIEILFLTKIDKYLIEASQNQISTTFHRCFLSLRWLRGNSVRGEFTISVRYRPTRDRRERRFSLTYFSEYGWVKPFFFINTNNYIRRFHSINVILFDRMATKPILQSTLLIWLDTNINENDTDARYILKQLRAIVQLVDLFTRTDDCVRFLEQVKNGAVLIFTSGSRALPFI